MLDLTLGAAPEQGFTAYVVYPQHLPRLLAEVPSAARRTLLLRATSWDGCVVQRLFDPASAAYHGCGGCLVDLASGYGDAVELRSLDLLAQTVREAHELGLPVACRVLVNAEAEAPDLAAFLDVPLAIAEEMGADCLVFPEIEAAVLRKLREPMVPYFLTAGAGLYERRPR